MSDQRAAIPLGPPQQHVYHASPRVRIGAMARYGILFLMPCGLIITLILYADIVTDVLVIPIFLLLAALMVWAYVWKTRVSLVTSPEGISYTSIAYHLATPWSNVEGIGGRTTNTEEETYIQGLTLSEPAPVFHVRPRSRFLLPPQAERFIPIETVVNPWRNTPLEQDVRRYAPHVFRE